MANTNLRLGIASISDLLINKQISDEKVNLKKVNLTIPPYQRPYKWTARNAIQLLDDIKEAQNGNKEKYRVGTLILHESKDADGKIKHEIVDGQQRIITFSLLLMALGEKQIEFLNQKIYSNEYTKHNISNNYRTLVRRIGGSKSEYNDDKWRNDLKNYVETQCEFIVIITSDVTEAFQFFDSQNARGKALYPHDLLKAYHLREMNDVNEHETERIVGEWEQVSQSGLADLFGNYLYRVKEWVNGNKAGILNEQNIQMFKGVVRTDATPFAQYYKGAYCYAAMVNSSSLPFVAGIRSVNAFQLDTPIVAGKPFFEYTKHYYNILKNICDNSKYEGFYINDDPIVKTLDKYFSHGKGNSIARLLFDTSVLLYVDRFCPESFPSKEDMNLFNQFVVCAFIWAYSLRAQYKNLGWLSAQNYIMGNKDKKNAFNMYKVIAKHDSANSLLSHLADLLHPLYKDDIQDRTVKKCADCDGDGESLENMSKNGEQNNYLYFFYTNKYFE